MNPLIRLILLLVVVCGGAYYGFTSYQKLKIEDQHKLDLARIEKEYVEKSTWVNVVPDAEKYRDERSTLAKWYFTELNSHYNKYPAFKDYYRVGKELDGKGGEKGGKKKKGSAEDAALKKQYFDLTKNVFDALKDNNYNPQFTATSNSLRLDLFKVGRSNEGGKPVLRFDLVLWGAQRRMDRETQAAGGTVSKMVTAATFTGMNMKFIDEKGKVFGEMNVTGDPEIKVDWPERWIEEFPPQAVIGYYELDLLPSEPVKMQLDLTVTSRSLSGAEIPGTFHFELPLDPSWKVGAGEKWEGATTEERSKDYIEGKAAP